VIIPGTDTLVRSLFARSVFLEASEELLAIIIARAFAIIGTVELFYTFCSTSVAIFN